MIELQALLVLCGVGVAGVAVVLLMGLFSASGTSYEEAVAQQRRAATELLALAETKNKPKKKEKKASKKQAKKEKRESAAAPSSEADAESEAPAESGMEEEPVPPSTPPKPHVEFSPPVVMELTNNAPPQTKIRKRGKESKVKPILINKEDPSCVSDASLPTPGTDYSNHFEEMHPKDEMELFLHEKAEKKEEVTEKKDAKPSKAAKNARAKAEVAKEEPRERNNSGEAPKDQRKSKKVEKRSVSEGAVETPREETPQPLNVPQPSELTTDKLLKQVASSTAATPSPTPTPTTGKGKKKKPEPNVLALMAGDGGGVNVGELVRLVREAALSRTEIQILTDALLNKHHDQLPQHSEWTEGPNDPMQKLKKQLADKEKALTDEIEASQALHAKLKELRATLNAERGRASAASRAAEQASAAGRAELHTLQARIQRLMDDNQQLGQEKLMLQSKLGAEAEAQAQRVQMEMHIQRLSESEAGLVQQLNALQAELSARVLEAGQVRCEAGAARDGLIMAQQHANELAQQLQEANRACNELEQQRVMAVHGEQAAQNELRAAGERLAEVQGETQRLASRVRAAEAARDDGERQRTQLSNEVTALQQQLAARETELAELRVLRVPATNGLTALPIADQHKAAELAKVESVVESLRSELAAAQRSSSEQRDQLTTLQDQLRQYQTKNNELRTKNWKVMEALQTAERALQTKASAMPAQGSLTEAVAKAQETQYSEAAALLRAACPAAAPGSPASRDWLQTFAENLKKELENKEQEKLLLEKQIAETHVAAATDARVNELREQNEHLQALVDKYKRIIDDTEGVLSRLQSNVTAEEQRWASQLADTQQELDHLRHSTLSQMQKKIDCLQEELQKAQGANHKHTLADAERIAEERFMTASLSNKQNVEVSNGPVQVGLE